MTSKLQTVQPHEDRLPTKKKKDWVGAVFGHLTVLSEEQPRGNNRYFLCRCECGVEIVAPLSNLHSGAKTSCGCMPPNPSIGQKPHSTANVHKLRQQVKRLYIAYEGSKSVKSIAKECGISTSYAYRILNGFPYLLRGNRFRAPYKNLLLPQNQYVINS